MIYLGTIRELIPKLMEYDMTKFYEVRINEPRNQRSLQQNKLLWQLIHSIAKQTNHDDNEIYCSLLEKADALSDYIITATEMEEALRKTFRGVIFVRKQMVNNKECNIYKVYLGSSKMTTKEMNELLDTAIRMATELGVYQDYYEG